jgi:hypothetical protein
MCIFRKQQIYCKDSRYHVANAPNKSYIGEIDLELLKLVIFGSLIECWDHHIGSAHFVERHSTQSKRSW